MTPKRADCVFQIIEAANDAALDIDGDEVAVSMLDDAADRIAAIGDRELIDLEVRGG
jgi:hypothetical protein